MASQVLLNTSQPCSDAPISSIKELCSSGTLSSVSSAFTFKDSQVGDFENIVEDVEIPVIDFSLLTEGTPDQQSQVIQNLGKACEEWGFFVLVNHGVPDKLRDAMMETLKGFFDLPEEEKRDYADTHPMNPIRYGTSFNAKVDDVRYWRDYLKITTLPEFHCPAKPPEFSELLQEYSVRTRELGRKLLGAIWESLGLETNYMNEALNLNSQFQLVACNFYPACPQPDLAMGLPPHSDHGLLTILYQNNVDGLEVKHNGKWVRVKPLPNSYLINTADHMEIVSNGKYKSILHRATLEVLLGLKILQIVSNGKYKSILHRAMVNGKSTRMSIVSAVSPSLDAVVAPAPQLVSSESPAAYRGMKFGEFMMYQQNNKLMEKSVLEILRI